MRTGLLSGVRSLLAGLGKPPEPVELRLLSRERLHASLDAGREVQRLLDEFAREGRKLYDIVMDGKPLAKWEMYPWKGGILDQRCNSQYFYHSHAGYRFEHGHFHSFYYHQRKLVHLVAIGVNSRGAVNPLYTFNRWSPGDTYFPAQKLKEFLPKFRIELVKALDSRLHAVINHLLIAFRAEIEWLFDQRDLTFSRYRDRHGGQSPFEDRSLEITSKVPVRVDLQVERLRNALEHARSPTRVLTKLQQPPDPEESPLDPGELRLSRLDRLSLLQLKHSTEAGLALRKLCEQLKEQGRTIVDVVMNGQPLEDWKMYPCDQGVFDERTRSQYYYHSHPQSPEHGHFHLFYYPKSKLVHLVGIAMDNDGNPINLFTVNRWVTDEVVFHAGKVKSQIPKFRMNGPGFDRVVGDFLRHLLALYQVEIGALLDRRDAVYARYRRDHDGREPYEDRGLEITSALDIQVEDQIGQMEREFQRRKGAN